MAYHCGIFWMQEDLTEGSQNPCIGKQKKMQLKKMDTLHMHVMMVTHRVTLFILMAKMRKYCRRIWSLMKPSAAM